jgi:predicted  nucleic acid-binding Zn-ribbon protein
MHPQMQLLVALQDMDEMLRETETQGEELEGLGFSHGGLENLKKAREELASQIDPSHASWYRRLTGRYGHAVVPVVNNLCTGCFANIPSQFVSKTNVNKVQKCESCGRLLYWP